MTSKSNSEETMFSCNHLTHFAVLFAYGDNLEVLSIKRRKPKSNLVTFANQSSEANYDVVTKLAGRKRVLSRDDWF